MNIIMKHQDTKIKNESSKHIIHLDAKNLYEWAITQHLPTAEFKCSTQDEIKKLDTVENT